MDSVKGGKEILEREGGGYTFTTEIWFSIRNKYECSIKKECSIVHI